MNLTLRLVQFILFSIPLFFLPWTVQAFELNKVMLFRAATCVLATVFLYECFYKKYTFNKGVLKNKWILIGMGAFIFILSYSTLLSVSPHLSFWGSYFRHQGALTFIHLFIFFLILILAIHTPRQREIILKTVALNATIVASYGILQKIGLDFIDWDKEVLLGRVFASLGHPNHLGQFLVITIFLTIYLAHKGAGRKSFWNLATLIQFSTLTLTMSRASFIGLFGGLIVGFFLYAQLQGKKKWLHNTSILLTLGLLFLTSAQIFHFSRFDFTEIENRRSFQTRMVLWPSTLKMIREAPILGFGLDAFKVSFTPYFSSNLLKLEKINELPDRAHNEFLDLLAQIGALGTILFYGFMMIWMRWMILQKSVLQIALISAVVASTIANQLGFYTITHYLLLTLLLAISLTDAMPAEKIKLSSRWYWVAIFILICAPSIWMSFKSIQADHLLRKGLNSAPPDLDFLLNAQKAQPHYDEYGLIYLENALLQVERVNRHIPEIANTLMELNIRNPQLYEVYEFSGYLSALQGNREDLNLNFQQAITLAPDVPRVWLTWAKSLYIIQEKRLSLEKYAYYLGLLPDDWKGSNPEKKRIFLKLNPEFHETLKIIIFLYEEFGNKEKAEYYSSFLSSEADKIK